MRPCAAGSTWPSDDAALPYCRSSRIRVLVLCSESFFVVVFVWVGSGTVSTITEAAKWSILPAPDDV